MAVEDKIVLGVITMEMNFKNQKSTCCTTKKADSILQSSSTKMEYLHKVLHRIRIHILHNNFNPKVIEP